MTLDRQLGTALYYNPADVGFEIVAQMEHERAYDFDIFLVVKEIATGELYYTTDSGCSCPSPFEEHSMSDLVRIDPARLDAFEVQVHSFAAGAYRRLEDEYDRPADVLTKVRAVLAA